MLRKQIPENFKTPIFLNYHANFEKSVLSSSPDSLQIRQL